MIVLDTDVVSALMRPTIDSPLRAWLASASDSTVTTAVTVMEIRYGLERLPKGRRRTDLEARFEALTAPGEGLAVLDFDNAAGRRAGSFQALRESQGRRASAEDMMIAAIAALAQASLATRNIRDFDGLKLPLINPWSVGVSGLA